MCTPATSRETVLRELQHASRLAAGLGLYSDMDSSYPCFLPVCVGVFAQPPFCVCSLLPQGNLSPLYLYWFSIALLSACSGTQE